MLVRLRRNRNPSYQNCGCIILKFFTTPRVAFVTDTDIGLVRKVLKVKRESNSYYSPTKNVSNSFSPGVPHLSMSEYTTNIMSIHYKIVTRDMPENVKT